MCGGEEELLGQSPDPLQVSVNFISPRPVFHRMVCYEEAQYSFHIPAQPPESFFNPSQSSDTLPTQRLDQFSCGPSSMVLTSRGFPRDGGGHCACGGCMQDPEIKGGPETL